MASLIREIPRNIPVPDSLPEKIITALSDVCIAENIAKQSDVLLVLCSADAVDQFTPVTEALLRLEIAPTVIFSSGPRKYDDYLLPFHSAEPEALVHVSALESLGALGNVECITETESSNYLDNIRNSVSLVPAQRKYNRIMIHGHSFASGRAKLTAMKYFPNDEICVWSVPTLFPGQTVPLLRETWHTFAEGRSWIAGEAARIYKYGTRGDILFPEKIAEKLEMINTVIPLIYD